MKFWELVSLFRDETEVLEKGFAEKRWSDFQDMFYDYDFLVSAKHDEVLDKIVPDLLMQKLAALSSKQYIFDAKNNVLKRHLATDKPNTDVLSMQAVIEKFGDTFLEEIEEKGSFKLPE
jgi:hypothetical protein